MYHLDGCVRREPCPYGFDLAKKVLRDYNDQDAPWKKEVLESAHQSGRISLGYLNTPVLSFDEKFPRIMEKIVARLLDIDHPDYTSDWFCLYETYMMQMDLCKYFCEARQIRFLDRNNREIRDEDNPDMWLEIEK